MNQYVEVAKKAARIGGSILLAHRGKVQAREKRPDDLVTQADLESQEAIREELQKAFPGHGFRGEEGEFSNMQSMSEWTWIVDPLDGTANFVHGLSGFAVSIALIHQGHPVTGVVFDPVSDEMFWAAKDHGAWLGAKRLHVSGCSNIRKAMICVSLPPRLERGAPEITCLTEVLLAARGVRRLGSAALNLAYIADGRLDGYWATSINPWDVAAGVLLVQEAGGIITDLVGNPYSILDQKILTSATLDLHRQLMETVRLV